MIDDPLTEQAERVTIALRQWNNLQPAWNKYKTLCQLSLDEQLWVFHRAAQMRLEDERRDQQVKVFSDRICLMLGIGVSADVARQQLKKERDLRHISDHPEDAVLPDEYHTWRRPFTFHTGGSRRS